MSFCVDSIDKESWSRIGETMKTEYINMIDGLDI